MRQTMPVSAGLLGYGGLLPFIGLAALSLADLSHGILYRGALLLYGAVILSFVGAIHWGAAMIVGKLSDRTRRACYVWSVLPSLIGWSTYLFSPMPAALILVLGFMLQYWRDRQVAVEVDWPSWYLPLRLRLTVVACISLLLGIAPTLS